jgi:hypothetical protein
MARFFIAAPLGEPLRLPRRGEDRAPPIARGVEPFGVGGEEFNRHVDEAPVQKANNDARLAGHRGVDGVPREEIAEQRVFTVRRAAADLVARVKVTHHYRDAFRLKKRLDLLAHERADVVELHVAGGVARAGVGGEQILPRAFRDGDDGVRFREHPLLQRGKKGVEPKRHLRDKRKVHILARDDRCGGDEARVATHEFHQPDAIRHAARLGVRAIEHAHRFLHRAEKSERARDEADVVVDGLRHADDRQRAAALARFLVEIICAALRAVAAHGEEDVHPARDEILHGSPDVHRPARRAENRAALLMNAIDELRCDLHRLHAARRIEPAVTAAKAEHLGDAIAVVKFEKERADDVVESRTQTSARHDARARLLRIEKEFRSRPRQLELDARFRTDFDPLRDADFVAHGVAECGGEARFAEGGCVHRKRTVGGFRLVE